ARRGSCETARRHRQGAPDRRAGTSPPRRRRPPAAWPRGARTAPPRPPCAPRPAAPPVPLHGVRLAPLCPQAGGHAPRRERREARVAVARQRLEEPARPRDAPRIELPLP